MAPIPITFDIDPELTALLVIDMQNGFAPPHDTIGAAGMDISMTRGIIPNIQRLVTAARAADMHVFWSRQVHYPDDKTRTQRLIPGHLARGAGRSLSGLCALVVVCRFWVPLGILSYPHRCWRAKCGAVEREAQ